MLAGSNDNEAGLFNVQAGGNLPPSTQESINLSFTCPAGTAAQFRSDAGVSAWRYRYFGVWPNLKISETAGTYHGAEIPMVFGGSDRGIDIPDTNAQKVVKTKMMKAWAGFVKDPEAGLTKLGWPKYDKNSKSLRNSSHRRMLIF